MGVFRAAVRKFRARMPTLGSVRPFVSSRNYWRHRLTLDSSDS